MRGSKVVYPVVLIESGDKRIPYAVHIPDFDGWTQGLNIADALDMAEDYISLCGIEMEDDKKPLPAPTPLADVKAEQSDIKTLVSADLKAYRAKISDKAVKKTLTIPSWLNVRAEKERINFSAVLQEALKAKLGIS